MNNPVYMVRVHVALMERSLTTNILRTEPRFLNPLSTLHSQYPHACQYNYFHITQQSLDAQISSINSTCTRTIYRMILGYLRGNLMMAKSAESCSF